jgi:hypothetical protein
MHIQDLTTLLGVYNVVKLMMMMMMMMMTTMMMY